MYYEELSPIVFAVIYNRLLRSERLVRLLTCYKRNASPYLDKSFDEEIDRIGGVNNLVYMGQDLDKCTDVHIYPLEHIPDAKLDQKTYLTVTLNGGYTTEVAQYKKVIVCVDVVVHDEQSVILSDNPDYPIAYRLYDIVHEIDAIINDKRLEDFSPGRMSLIGFQRRYYNGYFNGLQLQYQLTLNSTIGCDGGSTNLLPKFILKN